MSWPPDGLVGVGGAALAADTHKFRYGLRLAAALAHIALTTGDRVSVSLLAGARVVDRWGPMRGRGQTLQLLTWLENLRTGGSTELNAALGDYAVRGGRAGLVLLISDMLSPGGYRDGLSALQGRGHEVAILHLLSPDELEPSMAGDIRLLDSETGAGQDVTVDGAMQGLYARRLREWRQEMASYCLGRDVHYVTMETGTPWEDVVLYALRRAGVVR